MRHRVYGRHLNRTPSHRRAMFRNLAAALFEHGQIETTLPKAKAVQPFVERIITIAKKGTFTSRRRIESMINDRLIHAWIADPNVPDSRKENPYFDLPDQGEIEFNRYGEVRKAPRLVHHIMTKVAPLFEDRDGGYTRIVRTGRHRLGDGADLVILQLVGREEGPQIGGGTSIRREQANKRAAFAARLRKGAAAGAAVEEAEGETATAVEEPSAEQDAPSLEEEGEEVAEAPTEAEAPDEQDQAPDGKEDRKDQA